MKVWMHSRRNYSTVGRELAPLVLGVQEGDHPVHGEAVAAGVTEAGHARKNTTRGAVILTDQIHPGPLFVRDKRIGCVYL